MADNKQITFSVGGGNEVSDYFSRLRKDAESLARDLVSSSRNYSTSGKEVIKDIEDQIKAIERRNKLEKESESSRIRRDVSSGVIDKAEGKSQLIGVNTAAEQDKLQTQLLRDLIEVTKETARSEIREDRKNVEKQIAGDDSLTELGISGDEFEALKKTIQRQEIGDISDEERAEGARFNGRGNTQRAVNLAGGVGASKNELYGLATLFTAIPIIGQALSGFANKALSSAEGYGTALGSNVGLTGGTKGNYYNFGEGNSSQGYTFADSLNARVATSRARLSGDGSSAAALDILTLQRGLSLDQGSLLSAERLQRSSTEGGTTKQNVQTLISALRSTGVSTGGDLTAVGEYLQLLTELGQEQVVRLGKVDIGVNTKMVAAIAGLDESFKNPDVLKGVLNSIQGGLSGASSPQVEALQFAALSRLNPNASLFDLEKAREDPFGAGNEGYLGELLGGLQSQSGTQENFFRNIRGTFGLSSRLSEKLGTSFIEGGLTPDKIREIASGGGQPVDIQQRALEATSSLTAKTADFTNVFAEKGQLLVDKFDELINKLDELLVSNKREANIVRSSPAAAPRTWGGIPNHNGSNKFD